jgi:AAA domain
MNESKPKVLDLEDGLNLANESPTVESYLIENRMTDEGLSILCAKPKVGKTSLAFQMAVDVAEGRPFLGHPTKCGDVLYLYLEGPKSLPGKRLQKLGYTATRGKVHVFRKTMPRSFDEGRDLLINTLKENPQIKLVVVDTLPKLLRLQDSDRYDDAVLAMEWLEKVAQALHVHILCLVHAKKYVSDDAGDSLLGSTAFRGSSDTNFFLTKQGDRRILATEQRVGDSLEPTFLNLDRETQFLSLGPTVESAEESGRDSKRKQTRQRIETDIREVLLKSPGLTTRELVKQVTGKDQTIVEVIDQLEASGIIVPEQDGKATKFSLPVIPVEERLAA